MSAQLRARSSNWLGGTNRGNCLSAPAYSPTGALRGPWEFTCTDVEWSFPDTGCPAKPEPVLLFSLPSNRELHVAARNFT